MKNAFQLFLFILFFLSIQYTFSQDDLVGHWTFDDPNNLTHADVGSNLVLSGSQTSITGPTADDGAVNIGVGSYYVLPHGMPASGGGNRVNEFTLVMDVRIPSLGQWYCMYQTDLTNTDDGEWFINPSGSMGVGATGYTENLFKPGEWYRIAVAVKNGSRYDYYLDGQKALLGSAGNIDERFSLNTAVLLFADENGEDNPIDVADVKLFSRALTDTEMADLGGYGHKIIEPEKPGEGPVLTYLQTPTPTSVYVCWHSSAGTESIVEYGTTEGLGNTKTGDVHVFDDATIWHWVKLEGLTPETVYYYKAITDTAESEIMRLKTQPVDDISSGHIRFAVTGDNRTEPTVFLRTVESMKAKAAELYGNNVEDDLNLIIDVGDIVTSGGVLSQYKREYFNPLAPISGNVPVMVSIGNHEGESPLYYDYMKYEDIGGTEGEKYCSFRIGPVLFVAINSNYQLHNATQIQWLDNLLSAAQEDTSIDWIFTFCHHPGHSEIWPDGNTGYVQSQVIPTLEKYSKVDMLMYGHSHNYERGAVRDSNLRLMLSGGAGSALDRWGMYSNQRDYPEIQKAFDYYGYTIFDIDIESKTYHAVSYGLGNTDKVMDNQIIDKFVRDKSDLIPPETPDLVLPIPGAGIKPPINLEAAHYSGDFDIMSSQFQVRADDGSYDEPVIDAKRDFEDVYGVIADLTPIDKNEGIDLSKYMLSGVGLNDGSTYWWRVRYRDKNLQWSDWSEERSFSVNSSTKVEERGDGAVVKETRLYANYPNPFNPTTSIQFDIAKMGHVRMDIYNINGRLVKKLIDRDMPAGQYSVVWDGINEDGQKLASGIYFYRLSAKDYYNIKRAVLIK